MDVHKADHPHIYSTADHGCQSNGSGGVVSLHIHYNRPQNLWRNVCIYVHIQLHVHSNSTCMYCMYNNYTCYRLWWTTYIIEQWHSVFGGNLPPPSPESGFAPLRWAMINISKSHPLNFRKSWFLPWKFFLEKPLALQIVCVLHWYRMFSVLEQCVLHLSPCHRMNVDHTVGLPNFDNFLVSFLLVFQVITICCTYMYVYMYALSNCSHPHVHVYYCQITCMYIVHFGSVLQA